MLKIDWDSPSWLMLSPSIATKTFEYAFDLTKWS